VKLLARILLSLLLLTIVALIWLWPRYDYRPAIASPWTPERLPGNPVIYGLAAEHGYANINGPAVIRVPEWVQKPLGRYYLYFAHHKGSYLRLAVADSIEGPWVIYEPGVMPLAESGFPASADAMQQSGNVMGDLLATFSPHVVRDYLLLSYRATVTDPAERQRRGISAAGNSVAHVASPEVFVDEERQRLVLYYHGFDGRGSQSSRVATSVDGLNFEVQPGQIFTTYLRAFRFRDHYYLVGMPGVLYRSDSPTGPFEPRDRILFEPDMRHAGLLLEGSTLFVFWSAVGYAPERIMLSQVDLSDPDWNTWQATQAVDVMLPKATWEGATLPAMPSLRGELDEPANELRDPFVFRDEGGGLYLFYVGGGEQGIGVAKLLEKNRPATSAR